VGALLLLALLPQLGCADRGPPDARPSIRERLVVTPGSPVPERPRVEEQLLLGQLPAACAGARARLVAAEAPGDEGDWRLLLLASARLGARPVDTGGCILPEDGDALVASFPSESPGWRGARAEWLAARGRFADAEALLAAPGADAARLRVAVARGDGDAARTAAEGALLEAAGDVLACRILALSALEEGDAAWAVEVTGCGGLGDRAPELVRIRADALDRAGDHAAAEALYGAGGQDVRRAALLYQEDPTPERLADAARLLAPAPDRPPDAALHAVWLALTTGQAPSLAGLDESIPSLVARALVRGSAEDIAALERASSAPTCIARARVAARQRDIARMEAALRDALAASPAAEPVHRARIALRLATGGDVASALADWAAQDPDHVEAVGVRGSRDLPWIVLVPETWRALDTRHPDVRMRANAPTGKDAVGGRLRDARSMPDPSDRADALAAVAKEHPGLDGLVAERYRLGPSPAGLPERAP